MTEKRHSPSSVCVLGAGLTGLTAAYLLSRGGTRVEVLEAAPCIGGASRTVRYGEFRFDLGGHRLYSRNQAVLDLVRELLGDELLEVRRSSRIYLNGDFVDYPLRFFNALFALGPLGAVSVAASYAAQRLRRALRLTRDLTLEDWLVGRFGRRLYEVYFRPYSEKVWGVPCRELTSDFAEQRIGGLSFREAVRNMLFRGRRPPPTLISRFIYPRLGFGRIPEAMAASLPSGAVRLNAPVVRLEHDGRRVLRVFRREEGTERASEPHAVISTIPVTDLLHLLSPPPPPDVAQAAAGLNYRSLVVVFLVLRRERCTTDHWVYFPGPDVFFARFHEPKNWSPAMAPPDRTGLAVEIFCSEHDGAWDKEDHLLIRRTADRLADLGLVERAAVEGGCVVRVPKAYPLYLRGYRARRERVMGFLRGLENLHPTGRNAAFCYTSGDHCMEMGIRAAARILGRGQGR